MSSIFLPSMIEVEFGDYYKKCSESLFNKGFTSFHIDFGDKKFIGRELECWNKVDFLKKLGPEVKLTAHIMSLSGDHKLSVERISEKCLEENFEIIYIHSRSFKNKQDLYKFKEKFFKNAHHVFGIVSEVVEKKDDNLIEFVKNYSIQNLLQMGVPIGKGGQKFCWEAVERIEEFSLNCNSIINFEIDGGLTFEVINNLKKDMINRYSGWSIIFDEDPSNVISSANKILEII